MSYRNISERQKIKKAIIISSIIMVIIVGIFTGIIVSKSYNGKNVSNKVIKKDMIGLSFNIGKINVEITDENLDKVEIIDKENETDFGTKICNYNGIVKIKDDDYEIKIPFESTYVSSGRNNKWELWNIEFDQYDDEVELIIKSEATDEVIKKSFIGETISGVEITDSISDNITLLSKNDKEIGVVEIEAEFYDTSKSPEEKVTVETEVKFNGEKWVLYNCYSKREKNTIAASNSSSNDSSSISNNSSTSNNNSNVSKTLRESYLEKYYEINDELTLLEEAYSVSLTETENKELESKKYLKWDEFLNEIWTSLKSTMDSTEFGKLTETQISWITEKESIAKNKGGSLDSIEGLKSLSESTKSRCYTLINNYME